MRVAAATLLASLLLLGLPADAPAVGCAIQLNRSSYVNGDVLIAQSLRVTNTTGVTQAVEVKISFLVPGAGPAPFANLGADGSLSFPSGFSQDFGPLVIATVTPGFPRGAYEMTCRMRDPVTGELLAEDRNPFVIP